MKNGNGLKLALASLLVAGSGAAFAQDTETGKVQQRKVIIVEEHHDADGKDHARMQHHGTAMAIADCGADKTLFSDAGEEQAGEGKTKKTKILICSRGDASAEERAKRLERALARISADEDLSPETKTRITTALRDAIARVNTAK
jgi:hypothetical protein